MTTQSQPMQPPQAQPQPVARNNRMAVASLVLSLLWLFGLGSLLGVVFGHIALRQIKRSNELGRGLAIGGLVMGYLALALLAAAAISELV
jgi:NhaP-type Na+/H+ and K+/H+ antiporter